MRGLGLEEGTCSISLRVVYRANHPPRSQVLPNAKTTQQFSELVILVTNEHEI